VKKDFQSPLGDACFCKGKNIHCPVCSGKGFIGLREDKRLEPGEEWFPRSMARGRMNAASLDRDLLERGLEIPKKKGPRRTRRKK